MKNIGKTFGDELKAAGLAGLPFSWGSDGVITFDERMTPEQVAAVNSVYEAHDASISDHNGAIVAQISAVETAQPITQRSIRELMLAIGQAFPEAQASVFYKKAAIQESQVSALRDQLT